MDNPQSGYIKFSGSESFLPQEEMLEVARSKAKLTIGVPRELDPNENRVSLVPEAVALLIANGHRVLIENQAGKSAHFENTEYSEVGAEIVYSHEDVFKADVICKVSPFSCEEIEMMTPKQTIISTLHFTSQNEGYFRKLISKKVTAIALEYIKDKTKTFTILRSISEIAGNTSVLIAGEYLSNTQYGKGIMFGGLSGITPTEVVIIGAGTVGESAARAAMGLGAYVKVFDNSIYKLRRLQNNLNERIFTSIIHPKVLTKALRTAHVVIGAVHTSKGRTPVIVTEEMIREMKQGSVIIDVSIDQGGCVETSHPTTHSNPVFQKHGVTHYCVPNISSKVPHTASYALSNYFGPMLLSIGESGGVSDMLKTDYGLRNGVYLYNGILTNKYVGEYFNLPSQDIDLLIAAFMH